jgi:hypothetical protein
MTEPGAEGSGSGVNEDYVIKKAQDLLNHEIQHGGGSASSENRISGLQALLDRLFGAKYPPVDSGKK